MNRLPSFIRDLYLHPYFFVWGGLLVLVFILAYPFPTLLIAAWLGTAGLVLAFFLDFGALWRFRDAVSADRHLADRLSNGDQNPVHIEIRNHYPFQVRAKVIDEVPDQFQRRDLSFQARINPGEEASIRYQIRPTERGEYKFGFVQVFITGPLRLVVRRFKSAHPKEVPVYPGYLQMRRYELMAISNRLTEVGVKQIRRLGHTTEFDQIKEYVRGDDVRTINWKATARSSQLMVNQYIDERAQPVYCLIDKSRLMKMPFDGLTLLDYAINATLVLSSIAIYKQDLAGVITFEVQVDNMLPAGRKPTQMRAIQELLYNQQTQYREADFAALAAQIKRRINQRGLMVLFTNFETLEGMRRHLPYMTALAKYHLLVVVIFQNTELSELLDRRPADVEEIYIKTTAEQFAFEKRQIIKELEQHGIQAMLTPPEELTVNTLNRYLQLKARALI